MVPNVGRVLGTTVALVAVLVSCGDQTNDDPAAASAAVSSPSDPYVVATTGIWADIAARVACDGTIDVRTIVPPGGDPHAYEPSLRDREVLDGAVLIVANGLDLEESLTDTLRSVEDGGVPIFRVGDHVDTLGMGAEGSDDDHDGADPHIWFDPTRVSAALPALGDALVAAGADPTAIGGCVTTAQADLEALDEELTATLASIPADGRVLVTNHDALGYFADRYDFQVIGSVLPSTSTLTQASAGELEALGDEIDAAGVPAIFTETLATDEDATALAARLGVEVVELYTDALGEPGSSVDTYDGLLRYDAQAIAGALG